MPDASAVHDDSLLGQVSISVPTDGTVAPKKRKKKKVHPFYQTGFQKFNQNHGADGRFSSGDGGGTAFLHTAGKNNADTQDAANHDIASDMIKSDGGKSVQGAYFVAGGGDDFSGVKKAYEFDARSYFDDPELDDNGEPYAGVLAGIDEGVPTFQYVNAGQTDMISRPGFFNNMGDYDRAMNEAAYDAGVARLTGEWGYGSTGGWSSQLQRSAAHVFSPKVGPRDYTTDVLDDSEQAFVDQFVRSQYASTQAALKAHGVKSVKLYRGLNVDEALDTGKVTLPSRPLNSYTVDKEAASHFALGRTSNLLDGQPFMFEATVPAKDIFSAGGNGLGYASLSEVVVLGNQTGDMEAYKPIQKFNPNHDDHGRFATGAGGSLTGTEAGKAIMSGRVKRSVWSADIAGRMVVDNPSQAGKEKAVKAFVDDFSSKWNNGNSPEGFALERSVNDQLVHDPHYDYGKEPGVAAKLAHEADAVHAEYKNTINSYVRSTYAYTQDALAERGVKSVRLYRGVSGWKGRGQRTRTPLESWTTKPSVTESFVEGGGTVVTAEVPASKIFSVNMLGGPGDLTEHEVTVLGSNIVAEKYVPIKKYNQNHDENGRFAESDGGSGGPAVTSEVTGGAEAGNAEAQTKAALEAIQSVHKIPSLKSVKVVVRPREDSPGVPKSADGWYTPAEKGVLNLRDDLSSKSAMGTAVHELGHMIDHEQLGGGDHMATLKDIANPDTPMGKVGDAMLKSHAVQEIIGRVNEGRIDSYYGDYLMNPSEAFARAYTQWVAERSGNAVLRESVTDDFKNAYGQWGGQDFKPIGTAMDELFRSKGLLNETIEKFNPNHDENGRFAETTGGSFEGVAYKVDPLMSDGIFADPEAAARVRKTMDHASGAIASVHKMPGNYKAPEVAEIPNVGNGNSGQFNTAENAIGLTEGVRHPEYFAVHEIGHSLDHTLGMGRYSSYRPDRPGSKQLQDALKASEQFAHNSKVNNSAYWNSPNEMFARAYAQYVTVHSGDKLLNKQMGEIAYGASLLGAKAGQNVFSEKDWPAIDKAMGEFLSTNKLSA